MLPVIHASRFATFVALSSVTMTARADGAESQPPKRDVDLVIALDVSGSMEGLIESAKQRLWDITNELAAARPLPALRVAILSYGRPSYGAQSGFVRIDLPLTADLDAVNATLFAFRTDGGEEYVARAIQTSLDALQWSRNPNALKILFVAGNESAEQDPQIALERATAAAVNRGIVVNALYCGGDNDSESQGWRRVAQRTNGLYASIDQQAAAIAQAATPFDAKLAALSGELNSTYIALGGAGERGRANQLAQDGNAAALSPSAAASRAVAKAGALYKSGWDVVDAVQSGKALADIPAAELPAEMQTLAPAERETYVQAKSERRQDLQREIAELGAERSRYIKERSRESDAGEAGLDAAILKGIREVAAAKGLSFENR